MNPEKNIFFCGHCGQIEHITEAEGAFNCFKCGGANIIEEDYEIREWVRTPYDEYLDYILNMIETDPFAALLAVNAAERRAGFLTKEQITELRKVLTSAFLNGKTINQLAVDIKRRVQPGDLTVTVEPLRNKAGEIIRDEYEKTVDATFRSLLIARTETVRVSNNAHLDMMKDVEIDKIKWTAIQDEKKCSQCEEREGEIQEVATAEYDQIPLHPGCRCFFASQE